MATLTIYPDPGSGQMEPLYGLCLTDIDRDRMKAEIETEDETDSQDS